MPLTPLVQVNRSGSTQVDQLRWRIDLANINSATTSTDIDIIDILPRNNYAGSNYHGSLQFVSTSVAAGSTGPQPVQVLYSKDVLASSNPQDPSNANGTATTTWCDQPSGGTPVIGSGTCPAGAAQVTATRYLRLGSFMFGEIISALVTMLPSANQSGDIYVNRTSGAMTGLLPAGPFDSPETVIGSSVGDTVWYDQNCDGLLGSDEMGMANVKVVLDGTDDLGNSVHATTTTDSQGKYKFDSLRKGTYHVQVDPATLPTDHENTYSLAGGTASPINDSGSFTLGQNTSMPDADFGYAITSTTLKFVKKAVLQDVNTDSRANAGEVVLYSFDVTNMAQLLRQTSASAIRCLRQPMRR